MKVLRYAATAFIGFLSTPTVAQVATDYKNDNVGEKPQTNAAQVIPENEPDTTGVWYHINQKEAELAQREFARLKAESPGWRPADTLIQALANVQGRKLTNEIAIESFTPDKPDPPSLFTRLASMSEAQRKHADADFLHRAATQAAKTDNADFHALLGWTYLSQAQFTPAISEFASARRLASSPLHNQGLALAVTGAFDVALRDGDIAQVKQLRATYTDIPLNAQITAAGWARYDNQNFEQALTYFALSDFTQGQVLALTRLGQPARAAEIACAQSEQQSMRDHCAGYWSLQQSERYQRGAFSQSLQAADNIQKTRALTPEEKELRAWAQLNSGRNEQAEISFKALLATQPDNQDFAYALLSVAPDSQHDSLAQRFPAVRQLIATRQAGQAWQRKQFLLATSTSSPFGVAATPDEYGLSVYAGSSGRQRSGAQGLGNFDILRGTVGITDVVDSLRWDLRLDYEQLYSGEPALGSWFGDGQVTDVFGGITGFEDTGVHGSVQYETNALTLYGELNYALFSQPVEAKLTGQIAATWFSERAVTAVNFYRLRVEDSLLSMGSAFFEYSDEAFGGVHKHGVKALYSRRVADNTALSVSGVADAYSGKLSTNNHHRGLRLDLSYDVADEVTSRIDYWRIGPFVSWEGFDENRSGFTRGHGGYFSPEDLWSTGVYTELLTREGEQWQVKAALSAGYNRISENQAERFPLSSASVAEPVITSGTSSGLAGQVTLEGQYKLSHHWLIAGYVQQAYAVEYQATWAGLEIRWHAGQATGVTSDTLLLNDAAVSGYVF